MNRLSQRLAQALQAMALSIGKGWFEVVIALDGPFADRFYRQ
jgi:hypothetical protein